MEDMDAKFEKLTAFVADAVAEMQSLKTETERKTLELRQDFVQNCTTNCWHEVLLGSVGIPPSSWKTCCGWRFARLDHLRSSSVPAAGSRCERCFTAWRHAPGSSSTSSS